ncbi:MAG: TIGR04283 family arsenosugar biosynthesis glycosyltransferase [Hyphomicrobiales bacterium]
MITIVIPTLNAAESLPHCLSCLEKMEQDKIACIIICDGGSKDATKNKAKANGAKVIETAPGRGQQLHQGALEAKTEWILFLHADTHLSSRAGKVIDRFITNPENKFRAGYFRFKLDDESNEARKLERQVAWRCEKFALPYGDQALLINRDFYNQLGGYKNIALMEDVDLIWRIEKLYGKQALVLLDADATTSAQKFQRDGYFKRSGRNLFCLFLFWIKVPPHLIVKLY